MVGGKNYAKISDVTTTVTLPYKNKTKKKQTNLFPKFKHF